MSVVGRSSHPEGSALAKPERDDVAHAARALRTNVSLPENAMRHIHSMPCTMLALTMAAALSARDAGAVTTTRYYYANPTSYCQTALPVFDGNVRKRPLAVQNEGTTGAFITCSFTAQSTDLDSVGLLVSNDGTAAAMLTCTGVTSVQGGSDAGPSQYVAKTVTIPASGVSGFSWVADDFTGIGSTIPGGGYFSVSCNLPPGVGINDSYVRFREEVGA